MKSSTVVSSTSWPGAWRILWSGAGHIHTSAPYLPNRLDESRLRCNISTAISKGPGGKKQIPSTMLCRHIGSGCTPCISHAVKFAIQSKWQDYLLAATLIRAPLFIFLQLHQQQNQASVPAGRKLSLLPTFFFLFFFFFSFLFFLMSYHFLRCFCTSFCVSRVWGYLACPASLLSVRRPHTHLFFWNAELSGCRAGRQLQPRFDLCSTSLLHVERRINLSLLISN